MDEICSDVFREPGDQRLRKGVAEHQLGSDDQDLGASHQRIPQPVSGHATNLGREALEERRRTFVLDEVLDDGHTADLTLEVRVLDTRLDRVEWGSHRDRRDGTRDGCDEILAPRRLVVVLDTEQVLLRHC